MKRDLFDFLTRQQVYIEGVKNWQADDFRRYLKLLADKVRELLNNTGVSKLSELTSTAFKRLLRTMNEALSKVLGGYGEDFLTEFRRFARIDTVLQRSVFARILPAKDFSGVTISKVWNAAKDTAVPAFGRTVKEEAEAFISVTKEQVRTRLVQAQGTAEDVTATVRAIVGEGRDHAGGLLRTVRNRAAMMVATAYQHATSIASGIAGSVAFNCYQWAAVLDNRTSDFCRENNGKIFRYGDGPRVPAHPRCRSREIPCDCGDVEGNVPTFSQWLPTQSDAFLTDAFGPTLAKAIRAGKATLDEIGDFTALKALSPEDFELKSPLLTA